MSKTTRVWLIVIVVVLLVILIGMGSKKSAMVGDTGPIKIGAIFPLTGDPSIYGQPAQKTVALAVGELNAKGGINGRQIQMIYEDGKCTGQDAVSAVQKLISIDKVQAIIGGFCSSESISATPIAAQNKVLLVSPGSSSPALTNISPYFFRDYPSDATQGTVLADASYNVKHWKTVAFIQEQTDYAVGIYKTFNQKFQSLGGKVIKEEYASSVSDFRSQIAKLKAQNPDALFIDAQTPQTAARIITQLQELKWKPALLTNDAIIGEPKTIKDNAAFLEGIVAAEFLPKETDPTYAHMIQAYNAKYGENPPYPNYMATTYDSVFILRDGIEKVGYNGEKLAQWSRTISNWPGASGSITIGADGDRNGGHVVETLHNGQKVPLQ